MKKGDKLTCKRDFYSFPDAGTTTSCKKNEVRIIEKIYSDRQGDRYIIFEGMVDVPEDEVWLYFYTDSEIRKLKLKEINGN